MADLVRDQARAPLESQMSPQQRSRLHAELAVGLIPEDVDVLIVVTADRDDLDDIARTAQHQLGRPVNIRRINPAAWETASPQDAFLTSVRQRPLVELPISNRRDEPNPRHVLTCHFA
jgi:hypothetical protein